MIKILDVGVLLLFIDGVVWLVFVIIVAVKFIDGGCRWYSLTF